MKTGENRGKDKLFNFRPIFFTAVALCLGIFFAFLRVCYGVSLWWLCLLLPILGASFCFALIEKRLFTCTVAWLVMAFAFYLGAISFSVQTDNFQKSEIYNGEYSVVGKVIEKREFDYSGRILVDELFIGGERVKGKLNAYLPLSFYKNVELGDEVLLCGTMQTEAEIFDDFGFRSYAIGENLVYKMNVKDCVVTGEDFDIFLRIRTRVQSRIYAGMDKDAAAVTMAILTGDTSGMDEGLLENMRRGGIAHIFAVSGLHVGALYAFCLLLLRKTKLKSLPKAGRFCFLAVLLLFYGGICGFSPSIVRAIILCLVGYAARLLASSVDFLETLGLSALIVLCLSPVSLFEVGFQLSFAACLGIAFFQKGIGQVCVEIGKGYRKRFPRKLTVSQQKMAQDGDTLPPTLLERIARAFVSVLSVTLAVQIATAPILLANFGYISGWALLLNVFFVPIISAAFAFLLLFVVLACLLPSGASAAVLYLPNLLWSLILLLFEAVDFSTFSLVGWSVSPQACICYYGGCLFLTDKFHLSARWKRIYTLACFFTFLFLFLEGNL